MQFVNILLTLESIVRLEKFYNIKLNKMTILMYTTNILHLLLPCHPIKLTIAQGNTVVSKLEVLAKVKRIDTDLHSLEKIQT